MQLANALADLYVKEYNGYTYKLKSTGESLWILAGKTGQEEVAFRTAFAPGNDLEVKNIVEGQTELRIQFHPSIGNYMLLLDFPDTNHPVLRYTLSLKPADLLYIPFWPRDILVLGNKQPQRVKGDIPVRQLGTRTGLLYLSLAESKTGSLLYL